MDINILIQRLQSAEVFQKTTPEGETYTEHRPPTRLSLQAARALQSLLQLNESNVEIIRQLTKDNESLNEQIKSLQSDKSSGQAGE